MIVRKGVSIPLVIMSLALIFGCGREKPKTNFQLGEEHFLASNYIQSIMKLELWLKDDPDNLAGNNDKAHAMLVVMYHDDETRQKLYEAKFKKLHAMGEPGMISVLQLVEKPTTRSRLGGSIGDILVEGGALSVPPLMRYMKGPNGMLRTYALGVLIKLGKPAIGSLIQTLDDPDQYNRSRAVEALSAIGDKSAIKPLEAKLNDPSGLVKIQVAAALYGMGQTNATRKILLDTLAAENVQTRRVAARAIAEIVDDPPLKPTMKALNDADADVRNYAAQIAGKTGSAEIVQPLIKMLLEDENDNVKASAAGSLGKLGKPAVKPLIKLLEGTKELDLSLRLVSILGKLGNKQAVKPLEKIYKETTNPVLKDATAKALNEIP